MDYGIMVGDNGAMMLMSYKDTEFFMLDVGCCDTPAGDVNCDISMHATKEHLAAWEDERHMDVRAIPNFVQCDAQYLPFKDGVFKQVSASQILEHVPNYIQALSEFIRVASILIYIAVPEKEKEHFPEMHLHQFHPRTFYNALKYLGFKGEFEYYIEKETLIFLLQKEGT